tara:strand:+ start:2211 stop:2702 length:492 start_codon:yes stop_codon:yes gene_type:complete
MAQPTYPHNIEKEYVYWVERNRIGIAYKKDTLTTGVDVVPAIEPEGEFLSPHKAVTVRIYATKKAEVLTDSEENAGTAPSGQFILGGMGDKPEFDELHHEAILMYVLWKGYEKKTAIRPELIRIAQYWRKRYQECVQMALRTASSNRVRGPRQMKYNKTHGIL